jgi:transcriptional regulator of acetoin/glycerol metabolism
MSVFMEYSWPGNVRELQHAIEHAVIVCKNRVLTVDNLPEYIRNNTLNSLAPFKNSLEFNEPDAIKLALERAGGNKAKAARLLGISRQTLYRKLKDLGIEE